MDAQDWLREIRAAQAAVERASDLLSLRRLRRDQIIADALADGVEARSIAAELGISTQAVYRAMHRGQSETE